MTTRQERYFQRNLIRDIKLRTNAIVLKNDSSLLQGFPDLTVILPCRRVVFVELKRSADADREPNQEWYVDHLNDMQHEAWIVSPENKEEFLASL